MKRTFIVLLSLSVMISTAVAQTPQGGDQKSGDSGDIIRIATELVQTDVVVTDKSEKIIPDLKLSDFELYDNGKRQDLKFMEFISVASGRRTEGTAPKPAAGAINTDVARDISARDLKRVIAFVVDDLNIPIEDMVTVRKTLRNFVDNQMVEGDLVAIVRVIGGNGLLQQFTGDKTLLRKAISSLNVSLHPYDAFDNPDLVGIKDPVAFVLGGVPDTPNFGEGAVLSDAPPNLDSASDETQRLFRGMMSLSTAEYVIDSLKQLPGRKSLLLISGGIPIFEGIAAGTAYSNVSSLLHQLTDSASRAGVAISTVDPRGLKATPGVVGFKDTPAKSAGFSGVDPTFGRGGAQDQAVFGPVLAGGAEHLSLGTLANSTGGVAIINTNNFAGGLEKVLERSSGYYLLAYTPSEKFDGKFHKLEIKVKRDGARVYKHDGYVAREDNPDSRPKTKQQEMIEAAKFPLAKRDVYVSSNMAFRLQPGNKAAVSIDMLIDPKTLHFVKSDDGKYKTSFDVVGFIYDQTGKMRGGFSDTVNSTLSTEEYEKDLTTGVQFSTNTELPPGGFQLRAVVREVGTGSMGTVSKYVEIPNLANKHLAMSSLYLYGVNEAKGPKTEPAMLSAARQLSRNQALRYAAIIYNAKAGAAKSQLRTQLIISQGGRVLFKEPEQTFEPKEVSGSEAVKVGEVGISKVKPGAYVLTLVVTDPAADKKSRTVSRSIDFKVI